VSTSVSLSPLRQNENPMGPSLICAGRVWKAAELIDALRRGSGVARDAIYDMTTHCVTHGVNQGEPARTDCRDTIEEMTACILAAVHGGALRRAEFLPDFIQIVARVFLRQQMPADDVDAPDAVIPKPPIAAHTPVVRGRRNCTPAGRRPIRKRS